jgi:undecaprenyl-phosphate galactose phosphotransferase
MLKCLILQAVQVSLDLAIYWVSLEIALYFWTLSYPGGFDLERKIFFCFVLFICMTFRGLYQFRTWLFWDEMREVLIASIGTFLLLDASMFVIKLQLSRIAICAGLALFIPTCLVVRYLFRRAAFSIGLLETLVLVIGCGKTGEIYSKKVKSHPFMGCKVVGFIDDDPAKIGGTVDGIPVLGGIEDFHSIRQKLHVEEVVVAIPSANRDFRVRILDKVEMSVKRVSFIPDMYMLSTFSATMRDIDGLPIISSSQGLLNPVNRLLKGVIDYVGGLLALIVFSPVFLYVAWKIKRDDGGDVFFKQDRIGRYMSLFKVYKFRTMVDNAEKMLPELLKDEKTREEYKVAFKLKEDPRVTKVGRFLRRSSLDELPQLFNVLKGEMSLIGPRPFVRQEIEPRYGNAAEQVYRVKPGLTGLWQVSGRNDISDFEYCRNLDLYYIHNWSIWLDVVIIFRTIQILINRDGAY